MLVVLGLNQRFFNTLSARTFLTSPSHTGVTEPIMSMKFPLPLRPAAGTSHPSSGAKYLAQHLLVDRALGKTHLQREGLLGQGHVLRTFSNARMSACPIVGGSLGERAPGCQSR